MVLGSLIFTKKGNLFVNCSIVWVLFLEHYECLICDEDLRYHTKSNNSEQRVQFSNSL